MKKLVGKILLLIGLVLITNAIFYRFFVQPYTSYSWGYDGIHAKRMFLKENMGRFNTLFLGSSAMFRHMDVQAFDAACPDSLNIRAFNFGIPAMFPMQAEYIYRNLIEEDKLDVDYVFMDLLEVGNLFMILNTPKKRTHYWYSLSSYRESIRISRQYESSAVIKGNAALSYTIGFLARLFNAEVVEEVLLKEKNNAPDAFAFLQDDRNGFYALDMELEDTKHKSKAMENRQKMFLKDTMQNRALIRASISGQEKGKDGKLNMAHIDKINSLIDLSKANDIHLIFVLHPRLQRYEYPMLMPLFESIPNQHKIDLNHAEEYPSFYQAKYTFDPLHLNEEGAALFGEAAAKAFVEILKAK